MRLVLSHNSSLMAVTTVLELLVSAKPRISGSLRLAVTYASTRLAKGERQHRK